MPTVDGTAYHQKGRYAHAGLYVLRTDCQAQTDEGEDCPYSASYVAVDGAGPPGWGEVKGFCGLHVPDAWTQYHVGAAGHDGPLRYPVWHLDHPGTICGSGITRTTPPNPDHPAGSTRGRCRNTPFLAVRDGGGGWQTYCRVHTRRSWHRVIRKEVDPDDTAKVAGG